MTAPKTASAPQTPPRGGSSSVDRSTCPAAKHGTAWHRRHGCTCPDAEKSQSRYFKLYRAGLTTPGYVPILGTSRRLQALAAIGWSCPALGRELGITWQCLARWRRAARPTIHRAGAARIASLYDRLCMVDGGDPQAKRWAARQGWAPPLAWDEGALDDPDAYPDLGHGRPGRAQQRAAHVARLTEAGLSLEEIAREAQISVRTVYRLQGRAS